jgi:glucose-6-phosphate dehydrogenase assembly protein OpcA
MVLTLLILSDEERQADATSAAIAAARQHPMRIITLIPRGGERATRLDAEISVGGDNGPGEVAVLRLRGQLADHANSVAIPLLLADTPVVAYWPGASPDVPADDPIGRHAQRRILDASTSPDPVAELARRHVGYRPGDTDLSWTRITPWRSALAAALDLPYPEIKSAVIEAEPESASSILLATWIGMRLDVPVTVQEAEGPGITAAALDTADGPIRVERVSGTTGTLIRPGAPSSTIRVPSRTLPELLAEELRRLDTDETYGQVIQRLQEARA